MNAYTVVVNIQVNSSGAAAGVSGYTTAMNQIKATATKVAQDSAVSFNSIFGANFFADLAAQAVRSMASGFTQIVSDSIKAATQAESAFKGLGAVATNLGIDEKQATDALKNLNLVKTGLLNLSDGALSLKNLLATGFALPEAIDLLKAFGDTAAFGRQAALSFGYAISSATQGIKNQNSILVDNAGITKNISVILAEQGFIIQDLSDKYKGVAARQALYTGLLKEASLFQGDANRLLDTTQGKLLQVDAAYQRLLIALGKIVTESSAVKLALGLVVAVIDTLGKNTPVLIAFASAVGLITVALIAMNTASISTLPVIGGLIQSVSLLGKVMMGTASLVAGQTATLALASAGWLALGLAVAAVAVGFASYVHEQNKLKPLSDEELKNTGLRLKNYDTEITNLQSLTNGVASNKDEQNLLTAAYKALDPAARTRIDLIGTETERTKQLIKEKQNLLNVGTDTVNIEGTRRVEELSKAIQTQIDLRKEQIKAQENFNNISVLASTGGREEGGQFREERLQRETSAAFTRNREEIEKNDKAVKEAAQSLLDYSNITGKSIDDVLLLAQSQGRLGGATEAVKNEIKNLTDAQNENVKSGDAVIDNIGRQIDEYYKLTDLLDRSKSRRAIFDRLAGEVAESTAFPGQNAKANAKNFINQRLAQDPALRALLETERQVQAGRKVIDEILFPREKKQRPEKSELERLESDLRRLNAEVKSFTDLTSKEFKLRFERESLERTRRDFETILNLRRDIGLQLDAPLPLDATALQDEIRRLERLKSIKEGVRAVTDELANAERDLAIAQQTQGLPVIDAQTRALIGYSKAVRELRNSDEQLTADVIVQSRLRQDRMNDETRSTFRSYQQLRLDLLKETAQINEELQQNELLNRIFAGDEAGIQAEIDAVVNLKPAQQNELSKISDNVQRIADSIPSGAGPGVNTVTVPAQQFDVIPSTGGGPGFVVDALTGRLVPDRAGAGPVTGPRVGAGLPTDNAFTRNLPRASVGGFQLVPAAPATVDEPSVSVQTNTPGVSARDLLNEKFTKAAHAARVRSLKEANERILANEAVLKEGLISLDKDVEAARSDLRVKRLQETRATAISITLLEEDLKKLTAGDIEAVARVQQKSKESRVQEAVSLKEQIIILEDQMAHAGELSADRITVAYKQAKKAFGDVDEVVGRTKATIEFLNALRANDPKALSAEASRQDDASAGDSLNRLREISALRRELFSTDAGDVANQAQLEADRYEIAWLNALKNVKEADIEARESMIASQVRIADSSVLHVDQANAKVLEFIASQKTLTDIVADARIGALQTTYNFVDTALSKITSKLGVAGDLLKDILGSLIKMAINRAFMALFFPGGAPGGGGSVGASAAGGGGGAGLLGGLFSIFRPGASASGGGGGGGLPGFFGGTAPTFPGGGAGGGSNPFFAGRGGAGGTQGSSTILSSLFGSFSNQPSLTSTSISGAASNASLGTGAGGAASQAGGGVLQSIFGQGFNLKGLGSAFGSAAPALGAGLGASLGGQSPTGQLLGSAGGILAGGVLSALIGGSLTGAATGGVFGSIGGLLGISAGATAGIALAIAPLLLLGAYFLGRNKLRRQEEKQRAEFLTSSKDKLKAILVALRGGRLDSASALAQAAAIRADYIQQSSALKDKKTRTHALDTVRELDFIIQEIKGAGIEADAAAERFKLIVPTFGTGGNMNYVSSRSTGHSEHLYIAKQDDEAVLTRRDISAIGGVGVLSRAGVRGYESVNAPSVPQSSLQSRSVSFSNNSSQGGGVGQTLFVLVADDEAADKIVDSAKPGTVAKKMRIHTRQTGLDGYAGDVLSQL